MTARKIAYKALLDIEKNANYSNMALNKVLKDSGLSNKDRGLATEIVYGVVSKKRTLDYIINKKSKIKVKKMNHSVKVILRMGTYQLIYLDRVADYGVIDDSVNIMKKIDKRSAGFVNAILRNIAREKNTICEIESNYQNLGVIYSYEDWIVDKIRDQYGIDRVEPILKSLSTRPNIYLRINRTKLKDDQTFSDLKKYVIENLKDEGVVVRESRLLEEAIEVENLKQIELNKMFVGGYISVQDISSMLVARVMNPQKNTSVLDLCAAPGGKTCHIGELMENTGNIRSCDVFEHKKKLIKAYSNRLGLKNVDVCINDATKLNEEYIGKFDYVLCDVPCSGMGIVRRKPEIKYKKENEILGLKSVQYKILENASKYLKKGGILIYSTCTIFREENIEMVDAFLEENVDFSKVPIKNVPFDEDRCKKGYLEIMPDVDEMDGFFICKLKKI